MTYSFEPSYQKSLKSLPQKEREEIHQAFQKLVRAFQTRSQLPEGLGLSKLRRDFWEARAGLDKRILFQWSGANWKFILAGNHNEIRRFLKHL